MQVGAVDSQLAGRDVRSGEAHAGVAGLVGNRFHLRWFVISAWLRAAWLPAAKERFTENVKMSKENSTENVNFLNLREKSGLTLARLAELSGYSVATINGLELKNLGSSRLRETIARILTENVCGPVSAKVQTPKTASVATPDGKPKHPDSPFRQAGLKNAWEKLAQEDELTDRTLAASAGRRKAIEELVHERLEEMCMQEFPGMSLLIEDCTEAMKRFDLWVKAYRAKTLASKEQSEKIEP